MKSASLIQHPASQFVAAALAGQLAAAMAFIPLDPSFDTYPVVASVAGLAIVPVGAFTLSTVGWLPKIGWGRRWTVFAGGAITALSPWAALWLWDQTGRAEIPLGEVAAWGAAVTGVACLGSAAMLRFVER